MNPNPNNTPALSPQQQAAKIQQMNMAARQQVLAIAYPMIQSIYAAQLPAGQQVLNVPPQNVGLIKGFLLKITATITNPGSGSTLLTLTPNGPANLLQNLIFTDLQNYQRINTFGAHLSVLNSLRQGRPFLSSTPSDSPMGYGSNWPVIKAPATIATGTTGTVNMYYWIPLAYADNDLTGAIYANVVNATMNLQMTFATAAQAAVLNTADPTLAVYQGAGAVTGVTMAYTNIQIYQSYLDQLPMTNTGPILPSVDLNTMYEIKNTALTALVQNQDMYIPYSNFRHFLSTMVIFNNQLNGVYPAAGSDVNYWSLRSANATDLRKTDPFTWTSFARRKFLADPPLPTYLFDSRDKPIYTTQQGNMNLVLNPTLVNAGANLLVGWEMLANIQNLQNAGTLASS